MEEMNMLSDRVQKCISENLTKFDAGLWGTLVDFMTVYSKDDISVTFKDGTEIHIG